MDYLDILSTRSLLLFSPTKPSHQSDSPNTTPSTPTSDLPASSPARIAMPIQSLMEGHSECVYFLVTHVLATAFQPHSTSPGAPGSLGSDGLFEGLGGTPKELVGEAELLVWKEMDKAKMFGRDLGQWFRGQGNSRIGEKELERLAQKWGLQLQSLSTVPKVPEKSEEAMEMGSKHSTTRAMLIA